MVAVIEYGSKPTHPAAMYHIFNQVSNDQNLSQPPTNGNLVQNLDGTNDYVRDTPNMQDNKDSESDKALSMHQSSMRPYTHNVSDTNAVNDVDIDPNLIRRKRRRIGYDDHLQATERQTPEILSSNFRVCAQNAQATSFSPESKNESRITPDLTTLSSNISTNDADECVRTPKVHTPRKRRTNQDPGYDEANGETAEKTPSSRPRSLKPRSTPTKKKKMSIHANGKLVSSPAANSLAPIEKLQEVGGKPDSLGKNYKIKKGKFVQSLEVVITYGQSKDGNRAIGEKIDSILSKDVSGTQPVRQETKSITHPFFLGKVKPKRQVNEPTAGTADNTDNDSEATTKRQEPVPWKDIKFSKNKLVVYKSSDTIRPIWPPLSIQHIGHEPHHLSRHLDPKSDSSKAKKKSRIVQLVNNEDVLQDYTQKLRTARSIRSITAPARKFISGSEAASLLGFDCDTSHTHDAVFSVRSALLSGTNAFDRGECAGPNMWCAQFAPSRHSEVLQPLASKLHQWLKGLAVHNVKSGIDTYGKSKQIKVSVKKKRCKLKDEFDDFIVSSDDQDTTEKIAKNAILIKGPSGCGKTASVFAVAKELGFEVFEIHSGMRRSAKDIIDKVGDMAHNHLVQNGPDHSRSSSVALPEHDVNLRNDFQSKHASLTVSAGSKSSAKLKTNDNDKLQRVKKEQKQSLILFEEVDILFEDDRGFWSGVQTLIKTSKRPVVLTCNDLSSIPLNDLNLYEILDYTAVEQVLAVQHLMLLAAAEGHILDESSVSSLYRSKGNDLRASITELSLWCQMTVGSKQGGLDWMTQSLGNAARISSGGQPLRTFSQGTYQAYLDLVPDTDADVETAIRFNRDSLQIATTDWCDLALAPNLDCFSDCDTNLQVLSRLSTITDARSSVDILDDSFATSVSSLAAGQLGICELPSDRAFVGQHYLKRSKDCPPAVKLAEAFEPIMVEKLTFPPSQGRLAPSIDTSSSHLATDIAPYVRCIVNFDKRLEQQRDEVFGSQGKARKTRAARAAAEGGDKASTRSERWFPKDLNFDLVMVTGGQWPGWYPGEHNFHSAASEESSSPSSQA